MRILLGIILMFVSVAAFAINVNVICYSGSHVIFKQTLKDRDLEIMDGYIGILKDRQLVIVVADCIIRPELKAQPVVVNNQHH